MVFFVLKGGEYALRYLRYKQLVVKSSKCRLSIKSYKKHKTFFRIDVHQYQRSWKLGKLEIL
jgi:hypothetical protein